jgi:hypothetical protein
MVKKIHGGYYVYAMENVKNPETGRWQTKTRGILGKITVENGYVPNEDVGYTVLEYGAYHLAEKGFAPSKALLNISCLTMRTEPEPSISVTSTKRTVKKQTIWNA